MFVWFVLISIPGLTVQYYVPGPGQGGVIPLPQSIAYLRNNLSMVASSLKLVSNIECDVIEKAMTRYKRLIFSNENLAGHSDTNAFSVLNIVVQGKCERYPYFGMDEKYTLNVWDNATGVIYANTIWGALRGLETFSQLVFIPSDHRPQTALIRTVEIEDWPRFSHRGLLLDTSRHFLPLHSLFETIELMSESKLNVFHWHIVDDQSFPYTSALYANLSILGAYSPAHVYSASDIAAVIEYGRVRGVRVVVEFDTPGHTSSWGIAQPALLTQCCNKTGNPTGSNHLVNPTLDSTWDFLLSFFKEVLETFPDEYIHLGGDEVTYQFDCWTNNPKIKQFMKLYNWTDPKQIEQFYFKKLFKLLARARARTSYIVWQEVLDNKLKVRDDTIAHVWKGNTKQERAVELDKVTAAGHRTLLSSCWYLNYIKYGEDWQTQYTCDPQDFNGTVDQKNLVIGGEVCMWGEFVDATNLTPRLWPRATAIAERLWSDKNVTNLDSALNRLHEHSCRMIRRGFPSEPASKYTYCQTPYESKSPIY